MKRALQNLGKSLMQPVAVLPIAALLLGIGYMIDPAGWGGNSPFAAFLVKAGGAILDNLGILFAIGVSYGLSKDKNGAAALSGLVGFLTVTTLLSVGAVQQLMHVEKLDPVKELAFKAIGNGNVFIGILIGIVASWLYNRFHETKLPDFLAFFSGRRLVPILTGLFSLVVAGILFFIWPVIYQALVYFGDTVVKLGPIGAGIYGFFNRLLIPTGLHHALNNVFWFPTVGIGDIANYWNSVDPEVAARIAQLQSAHPGYVPGYYQAGFFPIMMFGLPAACFAMLTTAKPGQAKNVKGILLAAALTSFLTGVTEPIEFTFMFLAPSLYLVHALLTGISVAFAAFMHWTSGFSFSAGLFDYILGFNLPTAIKPYMLLVQGVVFAVIYFFVFRFLILKLNLKTPGREEELTAEEIKMMNEKPASRSNADFAKMAEIILAGLGGKENIDNVDYCITRLRVDVKDYTQVDEKKIKEAGISGIIRPSQKNVQVIIGPNVQFVKDEVDKLL